MATANFPIFELEEGGNKRLSVERIYQRKTQLEHILLRPDTYIGSVEESSEQMYVFDEEKGAIVKRQITFVPGLYKIFDEILVNAADNKQRDKSMNAIKIVIKPEENLISIWNNGRGIPIEMHGTEKMYVPELIFGTLLTSSNYDDKQKKVTGGRNGFGAKLCNIFSTAFTVETASKESGKVYKQTWKDNMGATGKATINSSKSDYTKVVFKPDLAKFKMTHLDRDTVALMTRRAYDIAGCTKGVTVYLNGEKLPVKNFRDYVELYLKGVSPAEDEVEEELPRKIVHDVVNDRWEVAVTASPGSFQQASFVNSIATTKGGTHVTYIVDQLVSKLLEAAKRRNKGGMDLKPFHIKGHLWVFINCLVENPTFDSQTKENMTLKAKSFGSTAALSEKYIKQAMSCGVVERVLNWARAKSQAVIAKKQSGSKHSKLRGIAKLDDANEAGGKNSLDCTLIVTEGDSAKTLAVSGLGVIGRDYYGVFPLRGKLLNVREASHNQIMANEEITNVVKILGLQYNKKYSEASDLRSLRYGRLMIMADQDQDGSHIKGLVINFIHHNWPNLVKHNFMEEFITPIVKVSKGKQELSFFSLPEFECWKAETDNSHTWRVKYYKGLGTSTSKEAKEYFSDMERHRIPFHYAGAEDDDAILLAFSRKCIERRKEWLTSWLSQRRERRAEGLNESFLYGAQVDAISFSDFINKELILFSNADNERSIPSVVDGLKPGQRKVLFTCFKRNDKKDLKVAQLAGSVAEHSAYHHGEVSLMSTIINLAQNFVGSNNINLLQPIGQFGTRLHGGKDAASPRYIFTRLSPLAKLAFNPADNHQLNFLSDDNIRIEPEWYCPILPLVLVNGADGIGTGYSTSVPNYDPREIIANLKRMMNAMEPVEMQPYYKNFTGTISRTEPTRYQLYGTVSRLSATSLEITELPVRTWTQTYKENVLETMLHGTEKTPSFIADYKEYQTDTTVRFVVTLTPEKMAEAEKVGFHKKFKLEGAINTGNLVLFDHNGCLKRYESATQILAEFYELRLEYYRKRKDFLEGQLSAECDKLENQARFILEKIDGKVVVENKRKKEMIAELKRRGYASDPVKAWKASIADEEEEAEEGEEGEGEGGEGKSGPDYNYLLSMQMWSLTHEKKEELLKNRDNKIAELKLLRGKTPKDLWNEDMNAFLEELDRTEQMEREEEATGAAITVKKRKGKGKGRATGRQTKLTSGSEAKEIKPSPFGELIHPAIPEYSDKPKKGTGRGKPKAASKKTESVKTEKATSTSTKDTQDGASVSGDEMEVSSSVHSVAEGKKTTAQDGGDSKQTTKQSKLKFDAFDDLHDSETDPLISSKEPAATTKAKPKPKQPAKAATKPKKIPLAKSAAKIIELNSEESDDDTPAPPSLAERLQAKKTAPAKKPPPASKAQKQGTLKFANEKTVVSSESESEGSDDDDGILDIPTPTRPARTKAVQSNAAKLLAPASGESDFSIQNSDSDDDFMPDKALVKKSSTESLRVKKPVGGGGGGPMKSKKPPTYAGVKRQAKPAALQPPGSDSHPGSDSEGDVPAAKRPAVQSKKLPAKKTAAARKPPVKKIRDSDSDSDGGLPPPKRPAVEKKTAAARKPPAKKIRDSDSDSDGGLPPPKRPAVEKKTAAAKKPPAKKIHNSDSDSDGGFPAAKKPAVEKKTAAAKRSPAKKPAPPKQTKKAAPAHTVTIVSSDEDCQEEGSSGAEAGGLKKSSSDSSGVRPSRSRAKAVCYADDSDSDYC